jgi:hypothetical protein
MEAVVRRVVVGLILSALGVGTIPATAQANGLGLFRRGSAPAYCPPSVMDSVVCSTVTDQPGALPPAPPGKKWVFEQQPVTVMREMRVQVGTTRSGQPIMATRVVPVTEMQLQARLVDDTSTGSVDPLQSLRDAVADLEKALGITPPRGDQDIQRRLENLRKIQGNVVVTLTAAAPADATATTLNVSSAVSLSVNTKYRIGTETVTVVGKSPDNTSITVIRGTPPTELAKGAVMYAAP